MSSIFNLKTSTAELSSTNEGSSKMQFVQYAPSRDVTGSNFPNGSIHIRWEVSGTKWWIPARSYIRMRATLTNAAGAQLNLNDDIAPNMGLMANLFQSAEFRINDKVVSRVSDYMAQVDALEKRLTKSASWMDSVGASNNFWQGKMKDRQQIVASDGLQTEDIHFRRRNFTNGAGNAVAGSASYGQALDFLNLVQNQVQMTAANLLIFVAGAGAAIPDLTKFFSIGEVIAINDGAEKVRAITAFATTNTLNDTLTVDGAALTVVAAAAIASQVRKGTIFVDLPEQASRRVNGMEFIWQPPLSIFKINHAMPAGRYELVLNPQTSAAYKLRIAESLSASKIPGTDYNFNIVNLYMYTSEIEGPRVDNITYLLDLEETRCQTQNIQASGGLQQEQFNVSPSTFALTMAFQDQQVGSTTLSSSSKYKVGAQSSLELNLTRMYINYNGVNRPQPDADPSYKNTVLAEDYTIQRYIDSSIYSGSYFDNGGMETIQQYHDRGSYYYFLWPRDATDRSTRVTTNFQFNNAFQAAAPNANVLLFDHFKKAARIRVENGRVTGVQVEEI